MSIYTLNPSYPPTRLYYYIKPHCRVFSTPPPHDCGQSSVVFALRGRGIPNTISLQNTSDGALVRCLRGVVWPRGLTGPDVLGELQMEPSDGGGPIRSFFPAILLYQNAVFFMFCNEKASNSVDTAWQLPCGPARTRHRSAASTYPDESRAICRIHRIRDHPLAAHDYGSSFSGSEARHSATARRNPQISA